MSSNSSPVVILVGGPNSGKSRFYTQFTSSVYRPTTTKATPNVAMNSNPAFVIVDTPGTVNKRNPKEYSWQGIFKLADVILDFGNWSESEILGKKLGYNPKYIRWSGDKE
jgi:ribosome-interacting GTPase 1